MLAARGYAIGPMILKRHLATLDARASMGGALLIAAVRAGDPGGGVRAERDAQREGAGWRSWCSGCICTALAFVVFSLLIVEVGPGRALVITYVNPVVAVALGIADPRRAPGRRRRRRACC